MDDGGGLVCERHGTPTRLRCAECDTPICPKCAIRTPVGFKCPDHAWVAKPRRRVPPRVLVPVLVAGLVAFVLVVRRASVEKPFAATCPTRAGPDVGIGDTGGGPHWTELARSPLCGRFAAASVWTGKEMLVWGGQSCAGAECPAERAPRLADGGAYEPARNRWRRLAAAPLAARDYPAAVWTGTELIVWGGTSRDGPLADGAAYDPSRNRWRALAASPLSPRAHSVAAWTGKEMLVWGGDSPAADGAAYDPAADVWRPLPESPLGDRTGAISAWTGKELVVWGGFGNVNLAPAAPNQTAGAIYDPATNAWRRTAPAPIASRIGAATAWTGQELLVWGGDTRNLDILGDGAAYNPAQDRWRALPLSPVAARADVLSVWTGKEMVVWGGLGKAGESGLPRGGRLLGAPLDQFINPDDVIPQSDGAAYDPSTNRWRRLEEVPLLARGYPVGVWDGAGMVVWGGLVAVDSPASASDGARYTP